MWRYLPAILSCLLLAAHHLRAQQTGLVWMWCSLPLLLILRRRWVRFVVPALLVTGSMIWAQTTIVLWRERVAAGEPALRMVAILGTVALGTALAGWATHRALGRRVADASESPPGPSVAAFCLSAVLLAIVQLEMQPPGILLERFVTTGGWLQGFWLAVYAAWLTAEMRDPRKARSWRPRLWLLFSAVFFLQLGLGLCGFERFLMTGKLHLPVPALIAAGPLYRGGGLFMLILFGVSLLLVGPAWCSWLCYIGAWDDSAARRRRRPVALPRWRSALRLAILLLVMLMAYALGRAGVSGLVAAWLAGLFGLGGVLLMLTWSRRSGAMTHCTTYCPIGWLATRVGKLSPFRIRISSGCTDCRMCATVCRYDALRPEDIARRKPGESCTLCGDCLSKCEGRDIAYRWASLSSEKSWVLLLVLICSLHAVFLGVARI